MGATGFFRKLSLGLKPIIKRVSFFSSSCLVQGICTLCNLFVRYRGLLSSHWHQLEDQRSRFGGNDGLKTRPWIRSKAILSALSCFKSDGM